MTYQNICVCVCFKLADVQLWMNGRPAGDSELRKHTSVTLSNRGPCLHCGPTADLWAFSQRGEGTRWHLMKMWPKTQWGVGGPGGTTPKPCLCGTRQIRRGPWTADHGNRRLFFNCCAVNRPVNNSSRNLALTNNIFFMPLNLFDAWGFLEAWHRGDLERLICVTAIDSSTEVKWLSD